MKTLQDLVNQTEGYHRDHDRMTVTELCTLPDSDLIAEVRAKRNPTRHERALVARLESIIHGH